jgi:hypothetical protein
MEAIRVDNRCLVVQIDHLKADDDMVIIQVGIVV